MKAEIVTIGDEILIGQITDTNSTYLASKLSNLGFEVRKIHSISDQKDAIIDCLDDATKNSDLVILTGGLGPTRDDITKHALLSYFGGKPVLDKTAAEQIKKILKSRHVRLFDRNIKQAEVPDTCQTLANRSGSAPGMLFRKNDCIVVSLPGVPFEMKDIFENELVPIIYDEFSLPVRKQKTLLLEGVPESLAAEKLNDWEDANADEIKLAYLPSPGLLRLRISVSGINEDQLNEKLKKATHDVITIFGKRHVFGEGNETLQKIVGKLLVERGETIAIAESCTGGTIAQLISSVPGSSKYFSGSVTAYSNQVKMNQLGVSEEAINTYGAVSQSVVEQMAEGVRQLMHTDYAIATSGIAGPDGGTPEKPVGTTWIAVSSVDNLISRKFLLGEHRERNVLKASISALNMLRILLLKL
jgi:nicotinamide-nucleotide amidase